MITMAEPLSNWDNFAAAGLTNFIGQASPIQAVLNKLMCSSIVLAEDWESLPAQTRNELASCSDTKEIYPLLVKHKLLTDYQAARVDAGKAYGLILGNYRILDRIGAGGMGIVFKAEHVRMRRVVAIKVLPMSGEQDSRLLRRFISEMRAVAQLRHPNIVSAIDDGETASSFADGPPLHYFVMEYVPGTDLDELVKTEGPLPSEKACGLIYQVASALAEAHKHNLVHRDIKPSNIRITPDMQAKLLDFGLVRQYQSRLTDPGTVLGTLDYFAPEQARDASSVDIRADIYGLGGSLYWCLTGKIPFPDAGNFAQNLLRRLNQAPPSARAQNPHVAPALDAVIARMMACAPDDRYATPQGVMNALLGFLKPQEQSFTMLDGAAAPAPVPTATALHRVLVVDDSATTRQFCAFTLQDEGICCDQAASGPEALTVLGSRAYDLVLTDWNMTGMTGLELCQALRRNPPSANLKIIVFSAEVTDDDVAQVLEAGADDYLTKQFSPVQLIARVKGALRLKESQDRADLLNRHLLHCNQQLEQNLTAQHSDLVQVRNALVLGLVDLVSFRDQENVAHVVRLQAYCRCLAEEAAKLPSFAGQIDASFIQMLECCAPLHDIGKAGLPDNVLMKATDLTVEERLMMQSHTTLGADTLHKVAQRQGSPVAFLQMAIDIARSHHERYDGKGYPDRLAGNQIPLAARILAIGDMYDGLRSRRTYKPALAHHAAMQVMLEGASGQFDPLLLQAFQSCAPRWDQIFRETPA